MSHLPRRALLALAAVNLMTALPAVAEDLSPDTAAQIDKERDKEMSDVAKKYGNKKPSEMTNEERREMAQDQAAAEQKVLDKHGVSAKDWSRYEATQSRSDRDAQKNARETLDKKEAEAAKAAANKKPDAAKEVEIQRGTKDNGDDDAAAAQAAMDNEAKSAPAKKSGGKKNKHR